ncbi:MAG: glutamate mutase L [Anaerolineales bacterium]|nr:glutamate mutase L [Anaerolineales bacterium]
MVLNKKPQEEFQDIGTLLALDIGNVHTRSQIFDLVEGEYRFLAEGMASSTGADPLFDVSEGVKSSINCLQMISGKSLLENENLVIPSTRNGVGVDHVAATISSGQPIRVATVGLVEDLSLKSIDRLLNRIYSEKVGTLLLNDQNMINQRIDDIVSSRPDLIIIAGGTDGGAQEAVLKLVNAVRMVLSLIHELERPEVIFAGNYVLDEQVKELLEDLAPVHITENILPEIERENLGPAQEELVKVFTQIHAQKTLGINDLQTWSSNTLQPTSIALGRAVQFLSNKFHGSSLMAIDLGGSTTTIAAAIQDGMSLRTISDLGIGEGLKGILKDDLLSGVRSWVGRKVNPIFVSDILNNKALNPCTIPFTSLDSEIEYAAARQVIKKAINLAAPDFPAQLNSPNYSGATPFLDYLLISGASLGHSPRLSDGLLTILDAVQPVGITFLVLDKHQILPALGAAALQSPIVPVQVLETSALLPLGYVIAPFGRARSGSPVLQVRVKFDSGQSKAFEIKQGEIRTIPLPIGRYAEMQLQPLQRTNIGWGPGKGGKFPKKVRGGLFGIIIDARGRPLRLSQSEDQRIKQIRKWKSSF